MGGARITIAMTLALLPLAGARAFEKAALALALSHVLVSIVKRNAGRPRPAVTMMLDGYADAPDQFSFPSGHSSAALSVAISLAVIFPALAIPALCLALLIGISRVVIGVHYPGDVVAGQLISIIVAAFVFQ
jgi:undecaprenyl-diphosphatase